jgi:hypothetical protein
MEFKDDNSEEFSNREYVIIGKNDLGNIFNPEEMERQLSIALIELM